MGRSESASCFFAYVITLRDLVQQWFNGCEQSALDFLIAYTGESREPFMCVDCNDYKTELFFRRLDEYEITKDAVNFWKLVKIPWVLWFDRTDREHIDYNFNDKHCSLWETQLSLFPIEILDCTRWGYNREGSNCTCLSLVRFREIMSSACDDIVSKIMTHTPPTAHISEDNVQLVQALRSS